MSSVGRIEVPSKVVLHDKTTGLTMSHPEVLLVYDGEDLPCTLDTMDVLVYLNEAGEVKSSSVILPTNYMGNVPTLLGSTKMQDTLTIQGNFHWSSGDIFEEEYKQYTERTEILRGIMYKHYSPEISTKSTGEATPQQTWKRIEDKVNYVVDALEQYKVQTASDICTEVYNYAKQFHKNSKLQGTQKALENESQYQKGEKSGDHSFKFQVTSNDNSHKLPNSDKKSNRPHAQSSPVKSRPAIQNHTKTLDNPQVSLSDSQMRDTLPDITIQPQPDLTDLDKMATNPRVTSPQGFQGPIYRDVSPAGFLRQRVLGLDSHGEENPNIDVFNDLTQLESNIKESQYHDTTTQSPPQPTTPPSSTSPITQHGHLPIPNPSSKKHTWGILPFL